MTKFLNANHVRIFDYPKFAEPLRDRVRERASALAAEAGITIEHIAKNHIRKELVVAKALEQRGDHPGPGACDLGEGGVRCLQALARQADPQDFERPDSTKCLHYYFYFLDAEFGLVYLRVPTWAFVPSSTFSNFRGLDGQVISQKISSQAMKHSASSIDKTVRPNGPVEAQRFFQSDQ